MVDVTEVDKKLKVVAFRTPGGALTIILGKIRAEMGKITPAERKHCHRRYHAIIQA